MSTLETPLTRMLGIKVPLICGAMYPCSNPELVAAVSEAGGIGIVQPMSLTFAHRMDLREGLRRIRELTDKPIGFNAIVEKTVGAYEDRMRRWVDIALEEGVRFLITALGHPGWVVEKAKPQGVTVFHDVTGRKHALKALDAGVDGLICVNRRAGGHAGTESAEALITELSDLGVPLICAGGIGGGSTFVDALKLGYDGVQMGSRFIATTECTAHGDYKQAIIRAKEEDIVWTDRLSGVPCAVIKTPYVEKLGLKAGPIARRLLRGRRTKKWVRSYYSALSIWRLKRASNEGSDYRAFWAAGKSVDQIHEVLPAAEVVGNCAKALQESALAKQPAN